MKYLYIWFAVVTVISAAVPQDLCETCVPSYDCPLFENLNVTEQLRWMEKFPCGSRKDDNFSVPGGFAAAAKGDYVCCSNNIWGVENPNNFGPRIGYQSGSNSQPSDNIVSKSKNNNLKDSSSNKLDYDDMNSTTPIVSNNDYYNNRSRGAVNVNYNIISPNLNVDNYNTNANNDNVFKQYYNGSTVWFPDRSRNYDNTDYWLNHIPDNNEDNNDMILWNNPPDREDPGVEARPPILSDTPDNGADSLVTNYPPPNIVRPPIQYDPPGKMGRPPYHDDPPENVPNFPITNYPPPNTRPPIQYDRPGNEPRPPNQFDQPGMEIKQPLVYNTPENTLSNYPFQNNPSPNVINPPSQNAPSGNEARPPILSDIPENGIDFPVTNYPPPNIVRPPIQYDSSGNMATSPYHYDHPGIYPGESQSGTPIQNMPPGYDDTMRPRDQYYTPGNFRPPNENYPSGNFRPPTENYPSEIIRPPNENYPSGNFRPPTKNYPSEIIRPPNENYPSGNFRPPTQNYSPGNFGPRNENYYPGNFGSYNQHYPPRNFGPPNQYYPPENSIPPNENYFPGNFGPRNENYYPDNSGTPNQYYPPGNSMPPNGNYPPGNSGPRNENYYPGNFGPPNQYYPPGKSIPPNQYFPSENIRNPPSYYSPNDYNFTPGSSNANNFPCNNDQRNRRNDNFGYNRNNPYYPGSPYNLYNQEINPGNFGGGQCSVTSFPPDPQGGCCGRQLADDDRIMGWNNNPAYNNNWGSRPQPDSKWRYTRSVPENDTEVTVENRISGGHATELYQYPWTVLLLTTFSYGQREAEFNCGGGLISAKYVLTAGHCVNEKGASIQSVKVHLAEYDKSTFPKDCKQTGRGQQCIENVVMYAEEVITHPQYENENLVNDIALLRLRGSVSYTAYIRPICLPSFNIDTPQYSKIQFEVAGWGRVGPYSSNIKQSTVLYLVNQNQCRAHYPQLTNKHLCAAGKNGKDTCKGDSGGPLMLQQSGRYYVVGIVSGKRSDSPCGTEVPSLYTNVYNYVAWIRSIIRN